jgi:hypothetical protein
LTEGFLPAPAGRFFFIEADEDVFAAGFSPARDFRFFPFGRSAAAAASGDGEGRATSSGWLLGDVSFGDCTTGGGPATDRCAVTSSPGGGGGTGAPCGVAGS